MYGFDPERTVMLKGVPAKVKLEDVKRVFALLDDVVGVHHLDSLPNTILCQFSESLTPMLLDREHPADDSYWEVMQIDEYCPPKSVSEPPTDDVVPLARAINDMTVNFREQVNELALTYNMSPITLNQVAVNPISGKGDSDKGPVTSTPASALKAPAFKAQSTPNQRPVVFSADSYSSSPRQAPNDTLLVDPLPADVQRVIVEHTATYCWEHNQSSY